MSKWSGGGVEVEKWKAKANGKGKGEPARNAYAYAKGDRVKASPLVAGVCDNFETWLMYARTARSSFELPPRGRGDNLTGAVTILMMFDGV